MLMANKNKCTAATERNRCTTIFCYKSEPFTENKHAWIRNAAKKYLTQKNETFLEMGRIRGSKELRINVFSYLCKK
jgi:hypothetical protein